MHEDQPPPYSESNCAPERPEANNTVTTQITIGVLQQTGYPEDRQNIINNHNTRSEGTNNQITGIPNASNSFNGFLDIMYEQRKLPSGFAKNMIYRVTLLIYYLLNCCCCSTKGTPRLSFNLHVHLFDWLHF